MPDSPMLRIQVRFKTETDEYAASQQAESQAESHADMVKEQPEQTPALKDQQDAQAQQQTASAHLAQQHHQQQ